MAKGASILLYRTTVSGTAPAAANLVAGEMGANAADATLFMKDTGGVVQQVAGKAPFASAASSLFWATPSGASGVGSLRAIVSADLPQSPTFTGTVTAAALTASPVAVSTSGLVSFWNLEEATSATRVDSFGTNNLADTNGCTQVTGKLSNAAHMAVASGQFLSVASNSTVQLGNVDWTWVGWWKLDSTPALALAISKVGAAIEYRAGYTSSGNAFFFTIGDNSSHTTSVQTGNIVSTGTWYFVVATFTASTGVLSLSVNNGTPVTATVSGYTPATGTNTLKIGATWDGALDAVGLWKRVLTANEITALYNGGSGQQYAFSNPITIGALTGAGVYGVYTDSQGGLTAMTLAVSGAATLSGATAFQSTTAFGSSGQTTTNASGVVSKYNGDTTAGNGLSSVVATATQTAQTASIGTTSLFTPVANGLYQVILYLVCTTAGTAGTVSATIGWTDDAKAQTTTTATASLASLGSVQQASFTIRAKNTAAITYATTVSGATGSPQYAVFVAVKRLS